MKATAGSGSLSWMVNVCSTVAPRVAYAGDDRVTSTVSPFSSSTSSSTDREIVRAVSPAEKVSRPEGRV